MKRFVSVLVAFASVSPALAGDQPAIILAAKGVQVYGCTRSGESYVWKLNGPEAILSDAADHQVGRHFAGPSWESADGSVVVGEPLVTSQAPGGNAIPWVVLRAKEHKGNRTGQFATVMYVVRSATMGGLAPMTGCDADHVGTENRVNYSAIYTFFPG